jgi:hypothetical protein
MKIHLESAETGLLVHFNALKGGGSFMCMNEKILRMLENSCKRSRLIDAKQSTC